MLRAKLGPKQLDRLVVKRDGVVKTSGGLVRTGQIVYTGQRVQMFCTTPGLAQL